MKRFLLALGLCLWASSALAQNPTCPTRPVGDNTNACASTAFVQANAGTGGGLIVGTSVITSGTSGGLLYNNGGVLGNLALPGANTIIGNWTAGAAAAVSNTMPSCADTGGNHLNYVNGTGVTCGTSGSGGGITALTGDVTASGTGSVAATVAAINGATLGSTTATSGNLLIGSGTAWVTHAMSSEGTISAAGAFALSRTFSPTMTGNWTFTPASGNGPTINTGSGAVVGLKINQAPAFSGVSATALMNHISITDGGTTFPSPAFSMNGLTVDISTGVGVTISGARQGFTSNVFMNSTIDPSSSGAFFVGSAFGSFAQVSPCVPSPGVCDITHTRGSFTGSNPVVSVSDNITNINGITGEEVDIISGTGATMGTRIGVGIILGAAGAISATGGTNSDFGLYFEATSGSLGWNKGIWFDLGPGGGEAPPIRSTGTVIGFAGSWTVANVIEASSINVTNSFITGPGSNFVVDNDGNTTISAAGLYGWVGLSRIASPGDGVIRLSDHTTGTFNRLQFGGTSASFPSIKRDTVDGTQLDFRLANDSADAPIHAGPGTFTGNVTATSVQVGPTAPSGNNVIRISSASATGRFFDVENVVVVGGVPTTMEAQYGIDAGGSAYAWCTSCLSTIFGTQGPVNVDFWANNLLTVTIARGTVSVADAQLWDRASAPSSSVTTGGLRVDGGAGIAGAIYAGGEITTGVTVVGSLPACNAAHKGARHFVTDSNAAFTAGIGAIVATGGANNVPVTCDGTNWRIG